MLCFDQFCRYYRHPSDHLLTCVPEVDELPDNRQKPKGRISSETEASTTEVSEQLDIQDETSPYTPSFPVVGIGASAGGIEGSKQMLQALPVDSRSNNDLLNLISSVEMAILMLGQDLLIRSFTPAAEKMLNLRPTDIGRPITDVKLNIEVPDIEQLVIDVIETSTPKEREVKDKRGRWHSLRIRPYKTVENNVEGALILLVDVDGLKRNQEMLRRQAELLERTHDAIFVWEFGGVITYWNRGAECLYGFSKEQALGRVPAELLSTVFSAPAKSVEGALERTGEWTGELGHRTQDGRRITVDSRLVLVTEPDGRRLVIEVTRDITERKQLEADLLERIAQLDAADRSKNEFLAMLAHELRNPLAPLKNAAQVLKMAESVDPIVKNAADMLGRQVQHMARMIDDLLDVSRIVRGKVQLSREIIDLRDLIAESVELTQQQFDARRQVISVALPPEPIYIEADPTRLEQVFSNLLNNASKFSVHGGRVWLTVETKRENQLGKTADRRSSNTDRKKAPASDPAAGEAIIRIRDEGMGITPELLPRVFDLFMQAEQSFDRSHGGLGIGLTVVRKLVELQGGSVEAHSAGHRQGSEFVVRLPMVSDGLPALRRERGEETAAAEPEPCRILVVEDNADAAESLAMLLRLSGHDVRIANDGPTSLQIASSFRPQVVLLDIGLPLMNGYEVASQLKQSPETEGLLLVAISGYSQEEDRRRSRDAGFDDYLTKPLDLDLLRDLLARHFPRVK